MRRHQIHDDSESHQTRARRWCPFWCILRNGHQWERKSHFCWGQGKIYSSKSPMANEIWSKVRPSKYEMEARRDPAALSAPVGPRILTFFGHKQQKMMRKQSIWGIARQTRSNSEQRTLATKARHSPTEGAALHPRRTARGWRKVKCFHVITADVHMDRTMTKARTRNGSGR